jgi:uncharacterized protein YjbI with pentapeptide repeats
MDIILQRYLAGEREFVDEEFDDMTHDLQGANLAESDFSRTFIFANFRGANLQGVKFVHANVKTCDFTDANLRDADFSGAALDGADFVNADLTGAVFTGATVQGQYYSQGEVPGHWPRGNASS